MVAVWAEQNDSNKYDIYYQKFDYNGDKVGETLLVRNQSDTHLTNLPTNEFTLNNSIPGDIFISTPHGMEDFLECQFLMETFWLETRIPKRDYSI